MKKLIRLTGILSLSVIGFQMNARAEVLDTLKTYDLQQIEVKASRMNSPLKNLPQKVEIITREQIESVPSENLVEVLKRVTNIDIIQYPGISAAVGMRGFSPSAHSRSYTLVLINGKPSGTNNLAAILPSNIERIEVIKGPYATLYGSDAMGGVINIITKTLTDELHGNISIEGGSFGYYKAEAFVGGQLIPNLKAGIGGSTFKQGNDYLIGKNNFLKMSNVEELILDKKSYGDTMNNSSYDMSHINALVDWNIASNWHANAEAIYTFANEVQLNGNYWGSYGQSKKGVNRLNAYGTLERTAKKGVTSLSPYFTREKEPNYSSNTADGFVSFESNISEYGLQLQHQHTLNQVKLVGGFDYGVYDYQSERFEAKGTPTSPYKPNNSHADAGIFAQAEYSSNNLDFNVGARFDHFNYHIDANEALKAPAADNVYNTINPSLGAQFRFSEKIKAHTSFGTAFSVPDAYKTAGKYDVSVYYASSNSWWSQSYVGNPDLKPENSKTVDFGLKFNDIKNGISFDATYFHTMHDNKIVDYVLPTKEKSYKNANESTMNGLELDARYNLGALFSSRFILEIYGNYTHLLNANFTQKLTGPTGADSLVTQDLLYVRKSNGNFGLYFRNSMGISARLNSRYVGSRFEKDSFAKLRPEIASTNYTTEGGYAAKDKILKHPDYLIFDLSVKYSFKNKLEAGCTVSNLLDENYSEKDGYNLYGRQVKISLGYRF
jgi:vitamin B12 transporter